MIPLSSGQTTMLHQWIRSYHNHIFITLGLMLIILLSFYQTWQFDFVNYDDQNYIIGNANIQTGFNRSSIVWAFTSLSAHNWHPLTWLSLILDHQLYGPGAGGYHVTNVLIHLANTLLLFFVFGKMTGELWKSGFVAALFAIHPLHVESVAWIMERKDVLSALFWLLTIGLYAFYARQPSLRRYAWLCISFMMGLMAKPMIVTLPLVLLLLDFWPLRRFTGGDLSGKRQLIVEKLPLFALSAILSAITLYAQGQSGALQSFKAFSFSERLINAIVSYGSYVVKMLWPVNLAFFYPYPTSFSLWAVLLSGMFLVAISLLSIRLIRRAPYLAMGWLWYLITMFPVCGLFQTGIQAMADRYTYVPLIGIFIVIAWGIPDLLEKCPYKKKRIMTASAAIIFPLLIIQTYYQTGVWQNSRTLFEHAIAVTERNDVAHNNLGLYFMNQGKAYEAAGHFREAVLIRPGNVKYLNNLGIALIRQNRYEEAIACYRLAVANEPRFADSYYNLADAYFFSGKETDALENYNRALALKPGNAVAENNIAMLLIHRGKMDEAVVYLEAAIAHSPSFADPQNNLGVVFARMGRINDAVFHIKRALQINPGYAEARDNLAKLSRRGQTAKGD
jgi:protein O-mannosyl-transferase